MATATPRRLGQAKRFSLQNHVDQRNGLGRLFFGRAMRDLAGVKLERQPVNGDGFHRSSSRSHCRQIAHDGWENATTPVTNHFKTSHSGSNQNQPL